MALTRKHFVELARITGGIECDNVRATVMAELAAFCRQENSSFDYGRFAEAIQRHASHNKQRQNAA